MTTPIQAWQEILDVSGLADLASEEHGHDLLDCVGGPPNAPLEETFLRLCMYCDARSWEGYETVLALMRSVQGFDGLRVPDHAADEIINDRSYAEGLGGKVRGDPTFSSVKRGTYSESWGSPQPLLARVRDVFPRIDLDLASSDDHNRVVGAGRYYSLANLCPAHPPVAPGEVAWCNPPGPCFNVKFFWGAWISWLSRGAVGAFLIFSLDHWRQLPPPPMDLYVVILRKRIRFVGAPGGANFPSALVLTKDPGSAFDGHTVFWRVKK